jgi:hypothetical protein
LRSIAGGCTVEYLVGAGLEAAADTDKSLFALRTDDVGVIVRAESMSVISLVVE